MTFTSDTKYKDWSVISVRDVPDCSSKGIYLRHNKTGLEVFHLLNDDVENMFAFAFRTPPKDSCGEAHILEHSVLCGSEKYPLKDPFIRLIKQSVKTFLNALTFPDKTVFPASSLVQDDYFNLMSVYGDAVFFPSLDPEIFLQEAHHLELDKEGKYSIQGVVYNEMKGNYSSFDSVAGDQAVNSLFPNTVYSLDSGGDPLEIPNITYQQLKDFHKKYYRADNCLVFLFGNIETEKQLDFIEKEFLVRLEKRYENDNEFKIPVDKNLIYKSETVLPFEKPIYFESKGPASEKNTKGATVMENWLLCRSDDLKSSMECIFLSEVLCGHDGSPLIKALLDSGLGEDISSNSRMSSERLQMMMTIGLRGVASSNIKEVEKLIFTTLNNLANKGIESNDIEAALMAVNFSNREIKRASGPYSLVIMRRALHAWNYGKEPADTLLVRQTFEEIEKQIHSDKNYVSDLLKKYLINNMHRSLVSVLPDANYTKERNIFEQTIISQKKNSKTSEMIQKENEELHNFQKKPEISEDCLPHIKPKNLPQKIDRIEIETKAIKTFDGEIPLFISTENTNGIVYIDIDFCADVLSPEEYPYVPIFTTAITNCGWNKKSWAETASLVAKICGDFGCGSMTSSVAKEEKNAYNGRDLIGFRVKVLTEKTADALLMISECLSGTDFSDTKRLKDLVAEYRNDFDEAIIPSGHDFAGMRAACRTNRSKAVDEIWNGISQLYTVHALTDMESLAEHCRTILSKIKEGGAMLHITADKESLEKTLPLLKDFTMKNELHALKEKPAMDIEKLYKLTELPCENQEENSNTEFIVTPTEVGFAASILPSTPWGTKESAALEIISHWMSTNILWEQLRTIGGAYGAFASNDPIEKSFVLTSYRDPTPYKSLKTFKDCLQMMLKNPITQEELEKCIVGCYSKGIQPRSPMNRGYTGFMRKIYGITNEEREKNLTLLFSITVEDIQNAIKTLLESEEKCINACIINNAENFKGKKILLPI